MEIISAVGRWLKSLFTKQTIYEAFGVSSFAVSSYMLKKQEHYRRIMKGQADWNTKDTPSLMLAAVVVNETVDEVLNDFKSEVAVSQGAKPHPRVTFLNELYQEFITNTLEEVVTNFLSEGETVIKPYMTRSGVDACVYTTDYYIPLGYDSRERLVDVVFAATAPALDGRREYKLFERHTWEEDAGAHTIVYRAFLCDRSEFGTVGAGHVSGKPVSMSEVPQWSHLRDITIGNIERPLFVHIRNRSKFKLESPQLQGLSIFAKALESGALEKLDKQEARTDWEFEGGELAVHASIDMFRKGGAKKGAESKLVLPEGKERLYTVLDIGSEDFGFETHSPALRIVEHGARLNQLKRDIELQTGMSYGILSDNNQMDRTAEEFRSSKKRLINTVMQTQKIAGAALDALVYSWDKLLDIHAGISFPAADYEVFKQWNESLAADRPREFEERRNAQNSGWIEQWKNYQWFNDVDEETAKSAVAELRRDMLESEY